MPAALLTISIAVAISLLGDQMLYVVLPVVHETVGVPVVSVGLLLLATLVYGVTFARDLAGGRSRATRWAAAPKSLSCAI